MNRMETLRERTEGFSASERALVYGFSLMVVLLAGLLITAKPAHADTTFTVNSTGDAGDININDDRCDTSALSGLQCTLRAAIEEANDTEGPDTINFDIDGTDVQTIQPRSPLPDITDPVTIDGYTQPGASANTLAVGNDAVLKIELDGSIAAGAHGLVIKASDSTIKGLVINRFDGNGIVVVDPQGFGATGNNVLGNFIGTNANGTEALGNDGVGGVSIFSAADKNMVGGTAAAARNVISGNAFHGVLIRNGDGNEVLGNYIGTDKNGTADLGNLGNGVNVRAADNTIGGTVSGARNVISGNGDNGVLISDDQFVPRSDGNEVLGNYIGTGANGTTDLGNTGDGVGIFVAGGSSANTVGGLAIGAGNRIAFNDDDGVVVGSSNAGNSVLSNSIFSNGGLGIDLSTSGVTNNDTDDPDTGSNNLQNFPVISSATRSDSTGRTTISGTLNSNPNQKFIVQCFVAAPDPSGHGEGQNRVAETTVETNDNGDAKFSCVSPAPRLGQAVTATATNTATGDTSEFSRNASVVSGP